MTAAGPCRRVTNLNVRDPLIELGLNVAQPSAVEGEPDHSLVDAFRTLKQSPHPAQDADSGAVLSSNFTQVAILS